MTMTEELQRFNQLRDQALSGLVRCSFLLMPVEIEKLGFELKALETLEDGSDELEFWVFEKEEKRMVFLQTYIEREGGLYFQSLYADETTASGKQKPA